MFKNELFRSEFEQYPFLCDESENLMCDFEIYTDMLCSKISYLRSLVDDQNLREDLIKVAEMVYHLNPTLRTKKLTVTDDEINWFMEQYKTLKEKYKHRCKKFVLPQGCKESCVAHILRSESKALVRMIYRFNYKNELSDNRVYDIANLLSGYFFYLSLKLNEDNNIDEINYTSRNYK